MMADDVRLLRSFRDRYLLTRPEGRMLVQLYYAVSPPFAQAIAVDDSLRAAARRALAPIVQWSKWLMECSTAWRAPQGVETPRWGV